MNKRVAYPIIIILFFILFSVTLRLIDYGLTNEGASRLTISHIYNAFDIIMVLFVPLILIFEQRDNKAVKQYFILSAIYIVYSALFNILALQGILDSDGVVFSVPIYIIILGMIYVGFLEDRDNNTIYRMGRSIMAAGIVHLVYVFVIPNNIERLYFTYAQMSLNPLTFIIIIMQVLLLDDILVDRQQKLDASRVRLNLEGIE